MTGSLRLRLFGLAAVTIALGLCLAWLALSHLFERHVRERLEAELANQILWFASNLKADAGEVSLQSELADPRYLRPFGGRYWQIVSPDARPLRSRSLWDEALPEPPPNSVNATTVSYEAAGPRGRLFVRAEMFTLQSDEVEERVQVLVATDYAEIEQPVAAFRRDLAIALGIIGACLIAAASLQVSIGLTPLGALRNELKEIRRGGEKRLDATVPREVRPLVEEVNELLNAQDEALKRARAQASDLAHGLKTPLTILSAMARRLHGAGNSEEAGVLETQVEMMGRRIDRQLARARLAPDRLSATDLRPLVESLVNLLRRTPKGERIEWEMHLQPSTIALVDEVDFAEAAGNILDNACKWARTKVRITLLSDPTSAVISVEDDGPGVPDNRFQHILARGTRLNGEVEGSGLGLAIAHDIVVAYGASLDLTRSEINGLRVRMHWRRATDVRSSKQ